MNDRQWKISAYAALGVTFVAAIVVAAMIADQLVHMV
jgi:hypothetical protein